MNELSVAEIMPVLYRGVLDSVAELQARNGRRDADRIRAEATRVYSRAWNVDAARRLRSLCERASRLAMAPTAGRSRYAQVLELLGRRPEPRLEPRKDGRPDLLPDMERRPV
ncbi:MAG TPA: hypothetical protein VJ850_05585 [Candidatus Limnocylindrales bacterium]|nr:hypothetical protein [Candidatus Limnocylindrales bacterium]